MYRFKMTTFKGDVVKKLIAILFGMLLIIPVLCISGCVGGNTAEDWSKAKINVYTRDPESGTREVFWEKALDKGEITKKAVVVNSNGAMKSAIAQDKYGIGYLSIGYLDSSVKAVKFNGIEPTIENVRNGKYPISRKLHMYVNKELKEKDPKKYELVMEFIKFVQSKEGQEIVKKKGYIPLPNPQPYQKKEGLKGEIKIAGSTTVEPIAAECAKRFMQMYPDVKITVSGGGSGFGIKQVGEGLVDIGDASRDAKPEELQKYPLEDHVIGMDGVAIIVNPANPIDNLNKEQVKKIFAGEITSWGQVLGQ